MDHIDIAEVCFIVIYSFTHPKFKDGVDRNPITLKPIYGRHGDLRIIHY